ncbi:hypothetical protein G8759_21725 [Spirosoma aureum]|uniref:Uncharacterized protein n=1 Tax=Spirosoma aureum TaxID=2692134 RepID=A0A6G9ARD7_9BACT|nr:hypothetical protein [Spirosoma aureum]QIP15052.1 hypothetical protein G8759_21725 [Spirosoma aureum]
MKLLLLTGFAWLVALSCIAQTKTTTTLETEAVLKKKIALACRLTDKDQIKRMNELHQTLFKKVTRAVEHPASYELVFENSDNTIIGDLAEFVKFERLCCPWLVFHLTFQSEEGPISLEMGDSTETKEMVYLVMELNKLQQPASK